MKNQEKHINEQLGRRVRKLRRENGWTQLELAVEARIDKSYLVNIENGKANPTLKKVGRLADALNVDVMMLFDWTRRQRNP